MGGWRPRVARGSCACAPEQSANAEDTALATLFWLSALAPATELEEQASSARLPSAGDASKAMMTTRRTNGDCMVSRGYSATDTTTEQMLSGRQLSTGSERSAGATP